ncbi:MAG: hypothetical protein AAGE03_18625, partial [Pseudomonadota bacterium]
MPDIAFRPVTRADLPMLLDWMRAPHLACDDDPDEQLALIESDFSAGPKARFTMWIGSWEGAPFAYLQDCDTAR